MPPCDDEGVIENEAPTRNASTAVYSYTRQVILGQADCNNTRRADSGSGDEYLRTSDPAVREQCIAHPST